MTVLLLVLSVINLLMGSLCVWALTQLPPGATFNATSPPENVYYLMYTAVCFLAPVIGWSVRKRTSDLLVAAMIGLPVLFAALAGSFRITVH